MKKTSKKWYQSRTIQVGLASILTSIAMGLTGELQWAEVFFGAQGIAMIILRLVTEDKIEV